MPRHPVPGWLLPDFQAAVLRVRLLGIAANIQAGLVHARDQFRFNGRREAPDMNRWQLAQPGPIVDCVAIARIGGAIVDVRMFGANRTHVHIVHARRYKIDEGEAIRAAAINALAGELLREHYRKRALAD